jgi:hypothetical protein
VEIFTHVVRAPRRSLLVELLAGIAFVAVIARRLSLDDLVVVLPASLVAVGVGILAFATRSRSLFWGGVVGAVAGVTWPMPPPCVLFSPTTDPADRVLIWARMVGEVNLQYALLGGVAGIAIGYTVHLVHCHRSPKRGIGELLATLADQGPEAPTMRVPRVRFTVRRMMLAVVVVALVSLVASNPDRHDGITDKRVVIPVASSAAAVYGIGAMRRPVLFLMPLLAVWIATPQVDHPTTDVINV